MTPLCIFTRAPRRPTWVVAISLGSILVAACSDGRNGRTHAEETGAGTAPSMTATTDDGFTTVPNSSAASGDQLAASFDELAASIRATVGVSIASDTGVRTFGTWIIGPAWSTIKVPLSLAAMRRSAEDAAGLVSLAIRDSDNEAAEKLWSQLGPPTQAAAAVAAVLSEAGDNSTVVQSERVRPGFSAFGQTAWGLVPQAVFAAALPCMAGMDPVVDAMRSLGGNQQWGFGGRPDTAAKGGWGPDSDGQYLVRQIASVSIPSGNLGVALAAAPQDGDFKSGTDTINALASWVADHFDSFAGVRCGPDAGVDGGSR